MTRGQLRIAKLIAERDEIDLEDAKDMVYECIDLIDGDMMNAEDILMETLGLEPDYLFDILKER